MKTVIWALLAAVLAGALGFFGGVTYQKAQVPTGFAGAGAGFARGGAGGAAGAGRAWGSVATGTVIAADAQSITLKNASGGSQTVIISAQTEISKQQVLTGSDIKVGDMVAAFGQSGTGGIDARMVQIVPPGGSFRFGGGGFGGGGTRGTNGGGQGQGGTNGAPTGP